jgi:hypothetical protein
MNIDKLINFRKIFIKLSLYKYLNLIITNALDFKQVYKFTIHTPFQF